VPTLWACVMKTQGLAWPESLVILLVFFLLLAMGGLSSLPLPQMIEMNLWPLIKIIGGFWLFLRLIDLITGGPLRRRSRMD
ncbi:MAG: hypothetical protein ACYC4K_11140, partial [Thiobacillus sp.]